MYGPIQNVNTMYNIICVIQKKCFIHSKKLTFQERSRVPKNVFVTFLKECVNKFKKMFVWCKKCVITLTEYMWHVLEKSVCKF